MGEKEAMIVDIERQGQAIGQKGRSEEVTIGQQGFAWIESCAYDQTTGVIKHIE